MRKIIEKTKDSLVEIEYTSEEEKFDIIRVSPLISYNPNKTEDYNLFYWPTNKTNYGQIKLEVKATSISAVLDVMSQLVNLGWNRKSKLVCRYQPISRDIIPEVKQTFFIKDNILEKENYHGDCCIVITLNKKDFNSFREDIKKLKGYKNHWLIQDNKVLWHEEII